jgi:Mannosyltransferase (PIG-V)
LVGRLEARLGDRWPAFRDALGVLLLTRGVVWLAAIFSARVLGAKNSFNASLDDLPRLSDAAGGVGHAVLTPLARWDSIWYLGIVDHDYASIGAGIGQARAAFFPLYPLLVWIGSGFGGGPGPQLVAAFVVSLAAFAVALYLLHRLVELELGRQHALATIGLLSLFPGALFFGLPYAESVFLLVSVGAFYAARTGRWAAAGVLAAAAAATRSAGLVVAIPLALIYLYGPRADRPGPETGASGLRPRHALRLDALWLGLAPIGLTAYSVYLGARHGNAFAWVDAQHEWTRSFAGPFGGIVDGLTAAWDGVRSLVSGAARSVYLHRGQVDPTRAAIEDIALLGFLIAAVPAVVGTFRRLPVAYGAYVVASLALPLSFPASVQPLESLPRYLAVLFPLFMWLAVWCRERRIVDIVAVAFAGGLGLFAAQYAAWEFVG